MSYNPNNPNGQNTSANSAPVVIASDQSPVPTTISSLPLPAGAATSANQTTANSSLATIVTNTTNAGTPVVSGTVTANAGTNLNTSALALESGGHLASVDTKLTTTANGLKVDGSGVTQPITGSVTAIVSGTVAVSSSALPTGAATATLQSSMITALGSPFQAGGSIGNSSFGISGTLPAFAATPTVNIGNGIPAGTNAIGSVTVSNFPSTQAVTGTFFQATQPISAIQLPTNLGNGAASGALTTVSANATTLTTTAFTSVTGTVNTDMLTGTTSGWYDAAAFNQLSVDIYTTTTVTGGVLTFEQTNDTTNDPNGITINLQDATSLSQTNVTTLTLAANTIKHYIAPINARYIRFRISTAFAGTGAVGATLVLKQGPYTPIVTGVSQSASGSLNATVSTVGSITSANLGTPAVNSDVGSAAITTTTTSATITPASGTSFQINIPVTVVTGTNPTLDIEIQESRDTGTNWVAIYDFPRITATGSYNSPILPATGNRIRYIQTVGGTTPSFTRAINRLPTSQSTTAIRQLVDRTISLTTLNSSTPSLNAESQTKNVQLTINIAATTIAPVLQIQGSDDAGATWYNVGTTLTAVANSTVSATVNSVTSQLFKATVTTAGTGTTAGYVLLRAF